MNQTDWKIGADPTADLWINDPDVSREHCHLIRSDSGYTLQDRGSTNGTFKNGQRIETAAVSATDQITLAGRVPMPWPDPAVARPVILIGFDAACDYQIDDKSVSGRHAELFLDPNGQWIIRDLQSTNGTWVGSESVKATPIQPDDSFRVGTVSVTAKQIVRGVSGESSFSGLSIPSTKSMAIASVAAGILIIGSLLVLSLRSSDLDTELAESTTTPEQLAIEPLSEQSLADPSTARANASTTPPASPVQPPAADTEATATDNSAQPSDRAPLTNIERVMNSLFVIVDNRSNNQVSVATAWAVSPTLLITNAHVVESIDKNQYEAKAVHVASGTEYPITQFGYHPSYLDNQQVLAEMITELRRLQQQATEPESDAERTIALVQEGKQRAQWIVQAIDTFDAGWLRIENEGTDMTPIELKTVPIEPSKSLRLASTYLEKDSAIFVPEDRAEPGLLSIRASQEPLVHPNKSTPIRWSGNFVAAPDEWRDYHFSGCPVLSLRGRLVGLCCGFSRKIISNDSPATTDNGLIDTIEIVPFEVIEQMVQGLQ